MEAAAAGRGTPPAGANVQGGKKRPSLLDRFKVIAWGSGKAQPPPSPQPKPAPAEASSSSSTAAAAPTAAMRAGRPPLPPLPGRGRSDSEGGNGGDDSSSRSQGAYNALAHLAIRHQMKILSRSSRTEAASGGRRRATQSQEAHPTVTLQAASVLPGEGDALPPLPGAGRGLQSGAGMLRSSSTPTLGHIRASSSLLQWGDQDTGSSEEGGDGEEDGSTVSDNNMWDESSDEEEEEEEEEEKKEPAAPPAVEGEGDPANAVTPKLNARTLATTITPSRFAERRKGLHISVDDEEEEVAKAGGQPGGPPPSHDEATAACGPLDASLGGTNTSSSVATTAPALTPYGGVGGPSCGEAPDRKEEAPTFTLGMSGSASSSKAGGVEAAERTRPLKTDTGAAQERGTGHADKGISPRSQSQAGGDFVFQPSPALQAARAVRGVPGIGQAQPQPQPLGPPGACLDESGDRHSPDGGGSVAAAEEDEIGARLSDEAEAEGRVVYSSGEGIFDLGGFTIGRTGLVRSPRNRRRRRPSLNAGDNFVVLARLGSGNSSAVHKALHVPTMRVVALKALPLYDAERRAQVMRELRILYSNLASIEGAPGRCLEPTIEEREEQEQEQGQGQGQGREEPADDLAQALATQARVDESAAAGKEKEADDKSVGRDEREGEEAVPESEGAAVKEDTPGEGSEEESQEEEEPEHCPYIVSFFDAFADAKHGCLTLVVEYMNGGSLQDLVDRGGCSNEDVLAHISYNVLKGLSYLHERKKIHRDIKPSNLLINSCGYVKIADFGVSRSLDGQPGADLMADTFIGTLGYMSPERITGQGYSFEADIWGFGLSILACALGAFPLEEETHGPDGGGYWGLVHAVCESPSPELPDSFTPVFRSFIGRCLAKDPTKRSSSKELLLHPFITSRQHLHKDAQGRIADFPERLRKAELDVICRAISLHILSRQQQEAQQQAQGTGDAALFCDDEGDDGHEPPQQRPKPAPDRATIVRRLAEELELPERLVGEKLEAAFEAIRRQEEEEAEKGRKEGETGGGGGGGGAEAAFTSRKERVRSLSTGALSRAGGANRHGS